MADNAVLPASVQLEYLNEGAANIVYNIYMVPRLDEPGNELTTTTKVESCSFKPKRSIYANKLLRLRKDLPTTIQVCTSQTNWLNHIAPLFCPSEIVQQSLVAIKSSGIISRLNVELLEWEQSAHLPGLTQRVESRRGTYLADEDFGLLVTDMTPQNHSNTVIEFKPKWLTQSLSAPSNSIRCRQCALNARRASTDSSKSGKQFRNIKRYCPLDLLSSDKNVITRLADNLLPPQVNQIYAQRFVDWVQNSTLLRRLQELQTQFDRTGVMNVDPQDEKFLIAMTIRDCTVFLRISTNGEFVEARIGDLDLKCASKISHWKQKEHGLIHDGWYEGTEDEAYQQPNYCMLGRGR